MEETHGELSMAGLPHLLHRIYTEPDPAGVLDIIHGQAVRRFFFKNGVLVGATSNVVNEVIGRLLLEEKAITQADYERSLEVVVGEKKRHGEVLIGLGLLTGAELERRLHAQLRRRVWKVMGIAEGSYAYRRLDALPAWMKERPEEPAMLMLEGISHGFYPARRLQADLAPWLDKPVKAAVYTGRCLPEAFHLNLQETRFLRSFDGKKTLEEVIASSDLLRHRAEALSLCFIITGMVKGAKTEASGDAGAASAGQPPPHRPEIAPAALFNAELLFHQAKAALSRQDYACAIDLFREIAALNPHEAEYQAYLGWTVFNKNFKNGYEAGRILKDALARNPDVAAGWYFLGMIYLASGHIEAAEKSFQTARSKDRAMCEAVVEIKSIELRRKAGGLDGAVPGAGRVYMDWFGFLEDPFGMSIDQPSFFGSSGALPALGGAAGAIKRREGHILIQGEAGAGKTTLVLGLLRQLCGERVAAACILDPPADKAALLKAIAAEFGCAAPGEALKDCFAALAMAVERERLHDNHALIIIDRAEGLSDAGVELASELARHKDIQLVLLGDAGLARRLEGDRTRELAKRLSLRLTLGPFAPEETGRYIGKRISACRRSALAAAQPHGPSFTPGASALIHAASFGVPGRINRICGRALAEAARLEAAVVDEELAALAIKSGDAGAAG
ncbi:MAG: AAA family ATPase [Deltaproteobacteria bacterium]|nr:AAA family ATPase [Deltaproteobacteria bacterium]